VGLAPDRLGAGDAGSRDAVCEGSGGRRHNRALLESNRQHPFRYTRDNELKAIILTSTVGGFVGALLLLLTSPDTFSAIIPWLLLLATAVLASAPALLRRMIGRGGGGPGYFLSTALLLCVSIYGGYFNGGLGIMLVAVFGLIGFTELMAMNGLKNVISAILSLVSVATYAVAGLIDAIPLSIATAFGGYFAAVLARRMTYPTRLW